MGHGTEPRRVAYHAGVPLIDHKSGAKALPASEPRPSKAEVRPRNKLGDED